MTDWGEWDEVLGNLDPEIHADLYEAAIDQAMTLEIGLAARCHVSLDQVLHATVTTLTGESMDHRASTGSLITRIEKAIDKRPLPGQTANEKAQEALSAARTANNRRHRVLHDQWIAVFDKDGPRLEHTRTDIPNDNLSPTRETLNDIRIVWEELSAVYYRILGILLFAKRSDGLSRAEMESKCETALSLISGVNKSTNDASKSDTPPF